MEFSSQGITLSVSTTEDGTYRPMYGFFSVPDLGKDPEDIDVTNFAHRTTKKISSGVKDYDNLIFDAYINIKEASESETTQILESYKYLRQAQDAGTKLWNKLTYPDGGTHTWKGSPRAWRLASNIKEALKFRYSTTVESDMTETYGSLSAQSTQSAQSSSTGTETTGTETGGGDNSGEGAGG